ncbi:hypothetical protein [Streptomyces montanus]|uniref:hypothetical protein n=1 Tax=Streptomyces montanus TaxID=2580423 RepID=UPI0014869DBC|nr:hypothetical protein [Streptomyces montanus]
MVGPLWDDRRTKHDGDEPLPFSIVFGKAASAEAPLPEVRALGIDETRRGRPHWTR